MSNDEKKLSIAASSQALPDRLIEQVNRDQPAAPELLARVLATLVRMIA